MAYENYVKMDRSGKSNGKIVLGDSYDFIKKEVTSCINECLSSDVSTYIIDYILLLL